MFYLLGVLEVFLFFHTSLEWTFTNLDLRASTGASDYASCSLPPFLFFNMYIAPPRSSSPFLSELVLPSISLFQCIIVHPSFSFLHYSNIHVVAVGHARSNAAATIYFMADLCTATVWEQPLFESGVYSLQPCRPLLHINFRTRHVHAGAIDSMQVRLVLERSDYFF